MRKSLEKIAKENGKYNARAIRFVSEGLSYTAKKVADEPRHVSGQTLCEGLRKLALEKWGPLSILVLNSWGVKPQYDECPTVRFHR